MSTSNPPPEPGHFSLLYFATASSFTKKDGENLKAPLPLSRLFDTLEERYPGIRQAVLGSCAVTVNLEYVDVDGDEHNNQDQDGITGGNGHESGGKGLVIQEGDEVAIIPPVSSG
ncbi:MAG: hypothetical protein M1837_003419 [Sclerophora amabilis]|nr:MAG: hypothetical protein M1837_003419 [Sclerophora amabilis]